MLIICYIFLVLIFLIWGSFLNSLSYKLIHGNFRTHRSFCPSCHTTLHFYDLVPVISYLVLSGKCRNCRQRISPLYPFIELTSGVLFTLLFLYVDHAYFISYFIFFSALIITIRSDFQSMLISRFVTLWLIPLGFLLSYTGYLPINLKESLSGTLAGGLFLYSVSYIFKLITKKEGLGQGDIDLLAFIGSFTGIIGCWASLLLGSLSATFTVFLLLFSKHITLKAKIPFGPFLATGALIFIFFQDYFYCLFSPLG